MFEKPATISLEEMRNIAITAKETSQYFLEGFMYQYHKQHKKMHVLLPQIGDIVHIKSFFLVIRK